MGVKVVLRALFLAYALTGVCLLVLAGLVFWMVTVSFIVSRSWDMSVQHMITTFCMCLGGGTLGGMLS